MIGVAKLLRRSALSGFERLRAPKKKKGEVEAKIESTDIVNIFKERSDPEIRDIRNYPIFVQQLSRGTYSIHDFELGISHDNPHMMPGRANLKTYLKAWKRQRAKAFGDFKHIDRKANIMEENDIVTRRTVFDIGRLGASEQAEKRKKEEEEEAAAEEEDDE